jgi:glycosyltransferase involved in cell wall biosynthesis
LIAAWEKLKLSDARLLLAGSMNLPRAYVNEHAASFEYLGALPRAELLDLMATVDLFVFPSLAEGFGLVIGEAMASGVPVLTTNNTGGPQLITDGNEGWCVSAHEVEPLIERLEWAHRNRDQLFQMGRRARQRAEQWTWADYRRKLIEELSPHLRRNGGVFCNSVAEGTA